MITRGVVPSNSGITSINLLAHLVVTLVSDSGCTCEVVGSILTEVQCVIWLISPKECLSWAPQKAVSFVEDNEASF